MEEYEGREQAKLKHEVLQRYLSTWGHKLGSIRRSHEITLWYVDCFAGPWKSQTANYSDTSVGIGLRVLQAIADDWAQKRVHVPIKAVFVEKDAAAFEELERLVANAKGEIDARCLRGTFESQVAELSKLIGENDPALFFIDPIGWSGAGIDTLAPLTEGQYREVLINVMTSFAHRFTGAENAKPSIRALLALDETLDLEKMSEEDLSSLYRARLKEVCGYEFAADIGIPAPTKDRIWYRLMLGTRNSEGLKVLRDVEDRMADLAKDVRAEAKERKRITKTNQVDMFAPPPDDFVSRSLDREKARAAELLPQFVGRGCLWNELWPRLLQECHVRELFLAQEVGRLHKAGILVVDEWKPRQRRVHDDQFVRLGRWNERIGS